MRRAIGDGTKFQDPTCPASGSWLRNGPISRISLGVRGGTAGAMTYNVSGNIDNEEGVLESSGAYRRSLRANLGFKPARGLTMDINQSIVRSTAVGFADGNSANGAELLLPISQSVERAKRELDALAVGGGTPLAAGLIRALDLAKQARRAAIRQTLLLLFTDGRANVGLRAFENITPEAAEGQVKQGIVAAG